MPNIVPQNRLITVGLALGLLTLIIYGFASHDPLTSVILGVIVIFFALPAALVSIMSRRARRRDAQGDP